MMNLSKIDFAELAHIYKNQPVSDGDTLTGSTKRRLKEYGLIETDGKGNNYTTVKGNEAYHKHKDKL